MTRSLACILEAGFREDFFTWCFDVATAFEWTLDFAGWPLFRFAPGFTFVFTSPIGLPEVEDAVVFGPAPGFSSLPGFPGRFFSSLPVWLAGTFASDLGCTVAVPAGSSGFVC